MALVGKARGGGGFGDGDAGKDQPPRKAQARFEPVFDMGLVLQDTGWT